MNGYECPGCGARALIEEPCSCSEPEQRSAWTGIAEGLTRLSQDMAAVYDISLDEARARIRDDLLSIAPRLEVSGP